MRFCNKRLQSVLCLLIIAYTLSIPRFAIASENLLFEENINNSFVEQWVIRSGNWYIFENTLRSTNIEPNQGGKIESVKNNFRNFVLEADVNNLNGIDEGIGFTTDHGGSTRIELNLRHGQGIHRTPEVILYKVINEVSIPLTNTHNITLNNSTWYHIKLLVNDNNIKVLIDNNLVIDYTLVGVSRTEGFIDLTSWSGEVGIIDVLFDNVKVTKLGPQPFLEIPWDYKSKGMNFSQSALGINSFFDHEYPLLSISSLKEPPSASSSVITYDGPPEVNKSYSSHDGYDYGKLAKVKLTNDVLAAASGSATYHYNKFTGNAIFIDHNNGYQTRYYHLLPDHLITSDQAVSVNQGDKIGEVGSTGNSTGPHLHFMVVQDKDGDGNFDNNIPDGITDPFGWQSTQPDPWENFIFKQNNVSKTGNKSNYLWIHNLDQTSSNLTSTAQNISIGNATYKFPANSAHQNLIVNLNAAPNKNPNQNLASVGETIQATATDLLGNPVTSFDLPFEIVTDLANQDLGSIIPDTLSYYSSSDGLNWTKEASTYDPTTHSISAYINHFTYFSVMAERADITPPVTVPSMDGDQGKKGWFKSDVKLTLTAQDNPGGLGVAATLYKINDGDWEVYNSPLTISREGTYHLEFYSWDNDENIEGIKSVDFNIDKTPPQLDLQLNPSTIWPPNGKLVDVTVTGAASDNHLDGNYFNVGDEYHLIEPKLTGFNQTIKLEASRLGNDTDGRIYTITATAQDLAGNSAYLSKIVTVPHDQSF